MTYLVAFKYVVSQKMIDVSGVFMGLYHRPMIQTETSVNYFETTVHDIQKTSSIVFSHLCQCFSNFVPVIWVRQSLYCMHLSYTVSMRTQDTDQRLLRPGRHFNVLKNVALPSGKNAKLAPIWRHIETCLVGLSHSLYFETAPKTSSE
jgi:hypothetical protein